MTDPSSPNISGEPVDIKGHTPWSRTDPQAVEVMKAYPEDQVPPEAIADALTHLLRYVIPRSEGARFGEMYMGHGSEHPARTMVRALFGDPNAEQQASHFEDPDFHAAAYALGIRLVQEYGPRPEAQPQQPPQPEAGGAPHA